MSPCSCGPQQRHQHPRRVSLAALLFPVFLFIVLLGNFAAGRTLSTAQQDEQAEQAKLRTVQYQLRLALARALRGQYEDDGRPKAPRAPFVGPGKAKKEFQTMMLEVVAPVLFDPAHPDEHRALELLKDRYKSVFNFSTGLFFAGKGGVTAKLRELQRKDLALQLWRRTKFFLHRGADHEAGAAGAGAAGAAGYATDSSGGSEPREVGTRREV